MNTWEEMERKFEKVTDALGMPIDTEIFETVVAMNTLNITTAMSCGGHCDHQGVRYPWVDIDSFDPALPEIHKNIKEMVYRRDAFFQETRNLRAQNADKQFIIQTQKKADEVSQLIHAAHKQIRLLQSPVRNRLAAYLASFYEDRHVPYDRRIILSGVSAGFSRTRMQNQGALDFYLDSDEEFQKQKLKEYREEMYEFTAFLKRHCFPLIQHAISA